jgi:replication factor C subunit 2/4
MTSAGTPWVELYRPKSLQDVSHQSEVVATLQNAVETGRMPHLLFYGPPGSGKVCYVLAALIYDLLFEARPHSSSFPQTSVALALCRQLWHPSDWKRRVLELNASDERGISVVREKIKNFASLAVGKPQEASFFSKKKKDEDSMDVEEKKYPNPPFKIIILDEADTVTPDAQAALRRIIVSEGRKPPLAHLL